MQNTNRLMDLAEIIHITLGGTLSVTVIVAGFGIVDQSSNHGQRCLDFTSEDMIPYVFPHQLWINSRTDKPTRKPLNSN